MPGKYPTITSPLTTRKTLTAGGTTGLSNSDKSTLSTMFRNSPIYSLNDTDYRALAKTYLQPDTQSDTTLYPHFSDPVNMNYQGTSASPPPDFPTDPAQYEGRYYPYLVVPTDPAALADGTSSGVRRYPNDNFGSGDFVTVVTPAATAAIISQASIEVEGAIAPSGQSGANIPVSAGGGTVTTHTVNPGATSA